MVVRMSGDAGKNIPQVGERFNVMALAGYASGEAQGLGYASGEVQAEEGFANLASESRTAHILQGNETGGGTCGRGSQGRLRFLRIGRARGS